jgi:hypothetical protein
MSLTEVDRQRLEASLMARLPQLLAEVAEGLRDDWPDYASVLHSDAERVADAGALFIRRLVEMSEPTLSGGAQGRRAGDETVRLVFEQIGYQQMQAGNDLTRLLTAFQLAGRVTWRNVSTVSLGLGLRPELLASLADAVFVFINQLSFSAASGYLRAQAESSRQQERSREELAELLLSGRATLPTVRSAATRAGWPLPPRATVVIVDPDDESARRIVDRLEPRQLPIRREGLHGVIVPDSDAPVERSILARRLAGAQAVVGYAVSLEDLPRSMQVAYIAIDLRRRGVLSGDPVFVDEHLDTIIVWRDPQLITTLRRHVLAPLDGAREGSRERLTETLTSWLRHQGDRRAVAEELRVHPQTVRYRLNQLHDLFGTTLTDPRSRARLFLVLCWPES